MVPRTNVVESIVTFMLRDLVRINPPIFLVSTVGKDQQEFLDVVYKVLCAMGVTSREKTKIYLYQLRDVSQVWYTGIIIGL